MELNREAVERTDFASARRGYAPAEVDAHLREVAAAAEALRTELEDRRRQDTLSGAASERVRAILDAAEASATAVRAEAQDEARRIVDEARAEANELTREAERRRAEAEADVEAVGSERRREVELRADELGRRADELEGELDRVLAPLRAAVEGVVEELRQELERLRASAGGLAAAASPGDDGPASDEPDEDGEPAARIEPGVLSEPGDSARARGAGTAEEEPARDATTVEPAASDEDSVAPTPHEVEPGPSGSPPSGRRAPDAGEETGGDTEGARLIALNMALSGSPREETAEYLRETLGIDDDRLLDDVYRRVEVS